MHTRTILALVLLAASAPLGRAAEEANPRKLLEEIATLQAQQNKINQRMNDLRPAMEKLLRDQLPKLDGKFAGYEWGRVNFGGGFFNLDLHKKGDPSHRVLWMHILYEPNQDPQQRANYSREKRLNYPAREFKDRWLWLQVGNVEIRAVADDSQPDFKNSAMLEMLLGQFNLKNLAGW